MYCARFGTSTPRSFSTTRTVRVVVRRGRDVVHPVRVGDDHRERLGLEELLRAAVEVADVGAGRDDPLAVDLQDEAEDAVRRRVLRPEVELHLVEPEERRPRQGRELRDGAGRRLAHESTFRFVSFGPGPPPSG